MLLWKANRVISSFLYLRELAVMAECFYWMCMHEGRRQVRVPVRSDHTSLCSLTDHKNRVQTPRGSANRLNWRGDDFQYQPFIGESQNKEAFKVAKRHRSGWTMLEEEGGRNRRHRLVKFLRLGLSEPSSHCACLKCAAPAPPEQVKAPG